MAISKLATYQTSIAVLQALADHTPTSGLSPHLSTMVKATASMVYQVLSTSILAASRYLLTVPGADLAAFKAATTTAKGSAAAVNDLVECATDTTDTALSTAKGSALKAGDVFRWTNVTGAAEAVEYVGNKQSYTG